MGPLIRFLLTALLVACGWARPIAAQPSDSTTSDGSDETEHSEEDAARAAFRAGVEAAGREDWRAAAAHFTASVEHTPRVAALYNLAIAHGHLGDHPELAYAIDHLLQLADPERHANVLREAERLRGRALRQLAIVALTETPADAQVSIDGRPVPRAGSTRTVYLTPGPHRIRIESAAHGTRDLELTARAGTHVELLAALPASASSPASPTAPGVRAPAAPSAGPIQPDALATAEPIQPDVQPEPAQPRLDIQLPRRVQPNRDAQPNRDGQPNRHVQHDREPQHDRQQPAAQSLHEQLRPLLAGVGWAAGAAVWLTGLVVGALAWSSADQLASADPSVSGFLSNAERYRERRAATIGLALAGGLLTSAATMAWPWENDEAAWWLALAGGALIASGAAILIRAPERLGNTRLTDPARALGSLLISGGAPLLLAPLGAWLDVEVGPTTALRAGLGGTF